MPVGDLSVTAASVAPVAGSTTTDRGIAGTTITAGQPVYLDSATNTIKLADANSSIATADAVGIALHGSLSGQPITFANGGDIVIGATIAASAVYIVSANAGGIAPVADLTTGWYCKIIGIGKTTTIMTIINRGPSTLVVSL